MNNQEALNKACEFLMKQGCAAISGSGDCQYLTDDGLRCAIGALLTEEQAREAAQLNYAVEHLFYSDKGVSSLLSDCSLSFLVDLQGAHDFSRGNFVQKFPRYIKTVAERWNLEVPECVKSNN